MERQPEKRKKGRRPLEPAIFARVEEFLDLDSPGCRRKLRQFALYFSIQREGDFRRIELPLIEARDWLHACWEEVSAAIDVQQHELKPSGLLEDDYDVQEK
jgi:hypothetical protein